MQEAVALHSSNEYSTKVRQPEKKYNLNDVRIAWPACNAVMQKPREKHALCTRPRVIML